MDVIDLEGRVVLITGAAQGLGKAMGLGLLRAGACVAAADLPQTELLMREFGAEAAAMGAGGRFAALYGDVTKPGDADSLVAGAVARFGTLDGLVNNAARGMQQISAEVTNAKPFHEVGVDAWRAMVEVNLNGTYIMTCAALRHMLPRRSGRVVNILTSRSTMIMGGFSPYGPTKAALEAATAAWAVDLEDTGVTMNALLPGGPADTRMVPSATIADRASLISPEAMVPPIVWFMSRWADAVTGKRIIAKDWIADLPPERVAQEVALGAGDW